MTFEKRKFVVGVSGGIACYKTLDLIRRIKEKGAEVSVIMTKSAMEFIRPLAFQTISERPVATSLFSLNEEDQIGHIKIMEGIDGFIIAPATANIIGKIANGIADDYLSTSFLASTAPLFIAPAMNTNMWGHSAVVANTAILTKRGAHIIQPEKGYLACGDFGIGKMAQVEAIITTLEDFYGAEKRDQPLKNRTVLVTAGPTHENVDAVRYISNYSSGKMGYAIAKECKKLGANVILVTGPSSLATPLGIEVINITTAEEMYQAVMNNSANASIVIKAAAVGDYKVENPNPHKTKKVEQLSLKLVKNRDILFELGKRKKQHQVLIGFAAESQSLENYARDKLHLKNLDLIIANNILEKDAGFNSDTNRILLIDNHQTKNIPLKPKAEIAGIIMDHVLNLPEWKIAAEGL
ncbi:MAG: bifunctional phosphopantothenoylcysteine decarboxylase/phosphopantothenate--cysteine ligase CoaBC [Proteobacteria bacterium]|nr:bifunctional phosphopantothenoylcysteine decarboxylase/phosphopantothenate--cysteine ligase CoaBC [Pseudomonadota bacterium]